MLPKTYNLVAVPSFGAAANFSVEFTPYRIDPTSGELAYGTPDASIDETANTDTRAPSATKDNSVDKMYGINGVMSCSGTTLTGTIDLYLVNQEASLTSDDDLSEPLASISFSSENGPKEVSFGN